MATETSRRTVLASALCVALAIAGAPAGADETEDSAAAEPSAQAASGDASEGQAAESAPARFETVVVEEKERPDPSAPGQSVGRAQLERSSRSELLESVAQEVPGFFVTSRGEGGFGIGPGAAGGIRMRGLGGSPNTEVLVLEDGIPDQMGIFGHPIPDAYQPAFVRSVEVLPGADSVLYGSGAMGGVLAVETRWPGGEDELQLSTEAGSFQTVSGRIGALGRAGQLDYLATGRAFHTEGDRDWDGSDQKDALLKLRLRLGGGLALIVRQRTTLLEGFDPGTVERPWADHYYQADRFNQALSLRHAGESSEGFATLYANVGFHRLYDGFRSRDQLLGLWAQETFEAHRTLRLTLGTDLRAAGGTADDIVSGQPYGSHTLLQAGLFTQAVWRPIERASATVGARLQHAAGGLFPLFKAGLEARPWTAGQLFARVAQGFRDPTISELYLPMPVANPDLKPERSVSLDAGVRQRLGDALALSLAGYRTSARDYIRVLGAWPSQQRENVAQTVSWGLEASARLEALRPFYLSACGSHAWLGPYTAQTPANKLDATAAFDRAPWRVSLSSEWLTGLYQRDYQEHRLPNVFFLDLRVDRSFWRDRIGLWAIARNLTNRSNEYVEGYPMPGLSLTAGVTASL